MLKSGFTGLFLFLLAGLTVLAQDRTVEVPMKFRDGMPAVEVMVNGQGPFLFAIDTGGQGQARADVTLVEKLGLKKIGEARAGDSSGRNTTTLDIVAIDSIKIGDMEFRNLEAPSRNYNGRSAVKIDGILGFNLFKDHLLTLDYPNKKVRIAPGELPGANGKDVLGFDNPRGIPVVEVGVGGQTVKAHLDSGNSVGGFVLPADIVEKSQLASEPRVVGTAQTVTNTFEIKEVKLKDAINLGGFSFPEPTVSYPAPSVTNIGARVLRDFALTFDQKNKRVRLVKSTGTQEMVDGETGRRLDELFTEAEKKGFHGVILFEQNGNVVLSKGYGLANEAAKVKFSPSTLVQIGSNVKDLTKIAVYQLIESGKLKPSDPLGNFVPNLTGDKQKITVQHLLDHQAGLPLGIKPDSQPLTTEEMLATLQSLQLKAEPGTREIYSNLGYSCLAYIIQKVSGQSFDRYVSEKILKPLGMLETGSYLPNFDKTRIAHGYDNNGRDIGIILDMPRDADGHLWSLRGNGGYLSTTGEMIKLYKVLANDSLLREKTHRLSVFDPAQPVVLAGSDMASFFLFSNLPDLKAQMIIASNHAVYKGNRLMNEVVALLKPSSAGGQRRIGPGDQTLKPALEKLPETGPGLTIKKYIESYNSGSEDAMKAFFSEYAKTGPDTPPIERRLLNYKNLRGNLGKLTFLNYQLTPEGGWEVHFSAENEPAVTFTFRIEPDKPWRLEGIQVIVGN